MNKLLTTKSIKNDENIYYADIDFETNLIKGYYVRGIHGDNIPEKAIPITEELWQELLTYGQVEVDIDTLVSCISTLDNKDVAYGMEHKEAFTKFVPEVEEVEQEPTEMDKLKEEVAELKALLHSALNVNV